MNRSSAFDVSYPEQHMFLFGTCVCMRVNVSVCERMLNLFLSLVRNEIFMAGGIAKYRILTLNFSSCSLWPFSSHLCCVPCTLFLILRITLFVNYNSITYQHVLRAFFCVIIIRVPTFFWIFSQSLNFSFGKTFIHSSIHYETIYI